MIDFHAHILPGVDDGSSSTQMSLAMLRRAAAQGVTDLVATPHFYADRTTPELFLERRARAFEELEAAAQASGQSYPRVLPGAEVLFFSGMSGADALRWLALGERVLLLEMPGMPWNEFMLQELERIQSQQGLQIVLAHIERYLEWQPKTVWQFLRERGVLFQCNAEWFCRRFSRQPMKMLTDDMVHILGSDCHNLTTRPPNLGEGMERIVRRLGPAAAEQLTGHAEWLLADCGY